MSKASVEDLCTMYVDTVSIYKNKPYYVKSISPTRKARCLNLLSQREEILPICEETFSAPSQRLGYVNVHGSVVYCTRTPVRKYKVGLSKENVKILHTTYDYDDGANAAVNRIASLKSVELGDCILGKYPTLQEAVAKIKEGVCNIVAFDRQFAISHRYNIYYKNINVGTIPKNAARVENIIFKEGFKHLITLLDNNYEKTLSVSRV